MKVTIIGGGAVGLATAFALRQRNADVQVIEAGKCGQAATLGNAGWVTPGYSTPLPAPGIPLQSLKWMLDPESPLLIRPTVRPSFLSWCLRFAQNCTADAFERGIAALVGLNHRTLELYDAMRQAGVEFEMHSAGLIFVAKAHEMVEEEARMLGMLTRAGYEGKVELLTLGALRELEPAVGDHVAGGVYAPSERHVRPESFAKGLSSFLVAEGVEIIEGAEVIDMARGDRGRWRVLTTTGAHEADRVVVAGGVASRGLLKRIGVRILLEAAKGYSITATGSGRPPTHALGLIEARVACSPFDGGVRLAGTIELGRVDKSVREPRMRGIVKSAEDYLGDWRPEVRTLEWAGMRPTTPDGLPLIGEIPGQPGMYLATGHAMLGVTLAPATGRA